MTGDPDSRHDDAHLAVNMCCQKKKAIIVDSIVKRIMLSYSMIERPFDAITLNDIKDFVTYARSEGATLDFKEAFPAANDKGVRDFLADVTAFANTDGGDIIIGVREDKNGVAADIVGIDRSGLDEALRRVEDQLRACVDPRVSNFQMCEIACDDGRVVLVIRVAASMIAPHRVTFKGGSRFFRRANRGNYEMSTTELRQAFAASTDLPARIRDLHHKAVSTSKGENMPFCIRPGPAAILTVAPVSVLRNVRDIAVTREEAVLPPRHTGSGGMRVGLNGTIVHSPIDTENGSVRSWSINHRLGYVDFAWSIGEAGNDGRKFVWPDALVPELKGIVPFTISRLRKYEIEGPWIAMLTLTGVKESRLIAGDGWVSDAAWQDSAYLGEIVENTITPEALKPFTSGFWRLFGEDCVPESSL